MSINTVTISGNLTRDAEQRTAASGTTVLTFAVAVNERAKDADGNWGNKANFVDCVMYGNFAAAIASQMTKGTKVCVQGKLRQDVWEKDGRRNSKLTVVASEIELPKREQQQQQQSGANYYDADLPF